jgi:hypothetical protein
MFRELDDLPALADGDPYGLPAPRRGETAPITLWLSQATQIHLSDVLMPEGHTVRALDPELAAIYARGGGVVLPRRPSC